MIKRKIKNNVEMKIWQQCGPDIWWHICIEKSITKEIRELVFHRIMRISNEVLVATKPMIEI